MCCSFAPSLRVNPMPPRINKAIGLKSLGRGWHLSQPLACVASVPNGVEHHCFMKPLSWDKQLGLALPLKCAAIQNGQTNNPSRNETGLDASHHIRILPKGGKNLFFLTSSFIGCVQSRYNANYLWAGCRMKLTAGSQPACSLLSCVDLPLVRAYDSL